MVDYGIVFEGSCSRVAKKAHGEFFAVFYGRFIACSSLVEEKFRHIDMEAQKEMLKQSLLVLLEICSTRQIPDRMREIARKHDRKHADITPDLYDLWLRCIIETAKEFDPEFDERVELAWRLVCSQGIAYMIFMYDK